MPSPRLVRSPLRAASSPSRCATEGLSAVRRVPSSPSPPSTTRPPRATKPSRRGRSARRSRSRFVAVDPRWRSAELRRGRPHARNAHGRGLRTSRTRRRPGTSGGDSFSFHANDGLVDSNTATVTISVIVPPWRNLSYVAVGDYGTAAGPHAVAIAADLNGDGKLDLVVAAKNGNAISSLLWERKWHVPGQARLRHRAITAGDRARRSERGQQARCGGREPTRNGARVCCSGM